MPRVLVVDDNADFAESLRILLRLWGHEPLVANDGPSALRLAAERRPDAALVDIGMPGMDGWEVARRLRLLPGLEHALLVAVSGQVAGTGRRAPEGDFDLYLLKPVEPDDLRRVLDECPTAGA